MRKLRFLGTLSKLSSTRWARIVWRDALKWETGWTKEIEEILYKMRINVRCFDLEIEEWKRYVNKKIQSWEDSRNIERIEMKKSLQIYPKKITTQREKYLEQKGGKKFCKFLSGQITLEAKTESHLYFRKK